MSKIKKKNKKNEKMAQFHKAFRSRSLTPYNLRLGFCTKWKASESYITPISFLQTAVLALILETFKSYRSNYFGSILGGFSWNLYKNFTSDAMQGNTYICGGF